MKTVILNDFNKRIDKNVDQKFFLMATLLDPRWKELKMGRQPARDGAYERVRREMESLPVKEMAPVKEVEVEPKPKKRKMLELDFDNESDEDGDEDDALDAELRRFEIKF